MCLSETMGAFCLSVVIFTDREAFVMTKETGSLRELCRGGKVYVRLPDEGAARRFLRQAEAEGFRFGDGVKPTARHYSDMMAIAPDGTLCYVTAAGRIAVASGRVKAVEWE